MQYWDSVVAAALLRAIVRAEGDGGEGLEPTAGALARNPPTSPSESESAWEYVGEAAWEGAHCERAASAFL